MLGSIIAEGAGVEPDQDVFARVIRKADILPILVRQGKGRRCAADFGNSHDVLFICRNGIVDTSSLAFAISRTSRISRTRSVAAGLLGDGEPLTCAGP